MNELINLYSLLNQAGIFKEIYDTYSTVFLEAALAFALLNCFFGYKLRKVWSCIFGLLLGIGTGLTAAVYLDQPLKISLIAAGIGGLVCMMLAFLLYRIGMFFLCIGTVIMILFQLFPMPTFSALCGFVVFGITAGFLAVVQEHVVVICITAVCGGIGSAKLISLLTDVNTVLTVLLAIVLSVLGLVFQFKPWKKKEYWKEEEEKNIRQQKEEHEHRKSRKKNRRKQKPQKSGSGSSSGRKRSSSYTQSSNRRRSAPPQQSSGNRRSAPLQQSFDNKRSAASQKRSDHNFDSFRDNQTNVPQNRPVTLERTSVSPYAPSAAPKQEPDSYTVDLSDIRFEISKEVQDIYREGHHNADH